MAKGPRRPALPCLLACALVAGCAYTRRSTPMAELPRSIASRARAPASLWRVQFVEASVPPHKRSGEAWDDDGEGLPDPYVRLFVNGRELWQGPVAADTLHPRWDAHPPRNVELGPDDTARVELWDDDGIRSDPVGIYEGKALGRGLVDALNVLKLEGGATVTVTLQLPQPMSGLGVSLYEVRGDALRVVSVVPHSPASRAGLKPGDEVVAIDDQDVTALGENGAVSAFSMAGQRGSRLRVRRGQGTRELVIERGFIWPTM